MSKYKIKITYGRYNSQYEIQLFQHMRWFIFSWWEVIITQRGNRRNIYQYKATWCYTFNITDDNVEDCTD